MNCEKCNNKSNRLKALNDKLICALCYYEERPNEIIIKKNVSAISDYQTIVTIECCDCKKSVINGSLRDGEFRCHACIFRENSKG